MKEPMHLQHASQATFISNCRNLLQFCICILPLAHTLISVLSYLIAGHRYWLINTLDTTHNHRYSEIYRTAPGSHVCADVNDTFFWTCLDCLDNTVATKREQVSWAGSDVIMFPSSGVGNDRVMLRLQQNAATRAPGSTVGHIYLWVPCSGQSREGCCDGFCRPAGTCYRPKDGQYTCDEGRWLQTWLYFCDT